MATDNINNNSQFAIFEIRIDLTRKGLANWMFVVGIVYKYLKMLRDVGPQKWIWDELKHMARIDYGIYNIINSIFVYINIHLFRLFGRN